MSRVVLDLGGNRTAYRPGETVRGTVRWALQSPPSRLEVRLFWHTRGKGTQDVHIEGVVAWDGPSAADSRQFELCLPDAPFSFSGKLISLMWALEAVTDPAGDVACAEIVVSPTGVELLLPALPDDATNAWLDS